MKRVWAWSLVVLLVLAVAAPGAAARKTAAGDIYFTVLFKAQPAPANATDLVAAAGGTVTYAIPEIGVVQARADAGFLQRMMTKPEVAGVSPSVVVPRPELNVQALAETRKEARKAATLVGPGDLYNYYQWDIKRVTNNGASWGLESGSHDVVVGVIDTGIYAAHPDLAPNLLAGSRNFVPAGGHLNSEPYESGDPSDVTDRVGHGTHVAGAIAGNGRIIGVGPNLGFRAYRVFGNSSAPAEWIWAAMIAAANDGVDVINMSLGGYDILGQYFWVDPETGEKVNLGNDAAYHVAINRVIAYVTGKGTTVVAAAGNDGLNATNKAEVTDYINWLFASYGLPFEVVGATFRSPGGHPGVITVSATGPDDSLASYSTYGPGYVTLAAPGGDFQRYDADGWWLDMNLNAWSLDSIDLPARYVFAAGTSMAAPKVSAVAALVKAQHPEYSPSQVAAHLQQTAEDLGKIGYDEYFGHGLANAYYALGGR